MDDFDDDEDDAKA
ncbi:hypothetical protein FB33_1494 [Cutibacterium acnes]|nr:hypothetical protein FB33_1494 [Cutibacterium acnes]